MIRRLFFFLLAIGVLLVSCSDNDTFSTDRGNLLTFSVDSVKMDTIFSTVPSSTYSFWVRNNSSDGIRIQNVRLERSGQSGFRANVDGTYLDPVASNFEIRKGDSLLVFIEVTTHENNKEGPQLIEDNLLFTLENGVVQKMNLRTWSWDAEKITSLIISRDTVIESSRPVIVYDSIVVAKDAVLTLRDTEFFFHDGAMITVRGRMLANGCLFRGDRLDRIFPYLPYDRISGQWNGIHLQETSTFNQFDNCEIRNAIDGIVADSTQLYLNNCVIHNCTGKGLDGHNSLLMLAWCQISNCGSDCLLVDGGNMGLRYSTLAQFYPFSAQRGAALRFTTGQHGITLDCQKTLITGYEADVVFGEQADTTLTYNFNFSDCILRTDSVTASEYFQDIIWETPKDSIEGKKHFKTIDEDNFYYDFSIDSISPAFKRKIGRLDPYGIKYLNE